MYSASVIAYEFVKKAVEEGRSITQMKLQKIVYFAHGYHLAKYNQPLIKETFEAWKFGPVVPAIYRTYKEYGSSPIIDTTFGMPAEEHSTELAESAREAIEYTWKATKDISAARLSQWTHLPESPWTTSYTTEGRDLPISNESIRDYFKEFLTVGVMAAELISPKTIKQPEEVFQQLEVLPESDEVAQASIDEITTLDDIKKRHDLQRLKRLQEEDEGRTFLRNAIFTVTVVWMFLVLLIVMGSGMGYLILSDTILVTLITTTTANVFGFFYVVVNYLFNKEKST